MKLISIGYIIVIKLILHTYFSDKNKWKEFIYLRFEV